MKCFMELVPCDKTYFILVELPKKVKLSKQAVMLNYGYLSPFKNFDIFYFIEDNCLYLWFIKLDDGHVQGRIPECVLIFFLLKKRKKDGIYVVKEEEKCVVNVKKSNVIREQVIVDCKDLDSVVNVLMVKYSFEREDVFLLHDLSCIMRDVIYLYSRVLWERLRESISKNGTSILFLVLIILYLVVLNNFAFSFFLKERVKKLREEFKQTVEMSSSYQDKLLLIESSMHVWENLLNSLSISNVFEIYNDISKLSRNTGMKIQNLSISGLEAKLVVVSKDARFMEKLTQLPYLKNVRLISSSSFGKENRYFVEFEIKLRSFNCR